MTGWNTEALMEADKRFVWHPFTDNREWCSSEHEPLLLVKGRGALLYDSHGREYIDGNASIWTNVHGHNHPHISEAIRRQLERAAHTSFLGFTHPAAIELARAIVGLFPADTLTRVFYSDDGSTGIEVALRIADQYWRLRNSRRNQFIAFQDGYHGDTAGAASLGAAAMFGPTRWTNLFFPCRALVWGDVVGGPLSGVMGEHIRDVPVSTRQHFGFLTHTLYWSRSSADIGGSHIGALRDALDLTDQNSTRA
jgi:adenosylmethionine-8-amino-7-oxononanoate aminotransferase